MIAAVEWYEGQASGTGTRFASAFHQTLQRIVDNPYQYQTVDGWFVRPLSRDFHMDCCTLRQTMKSSYFPVFTDGAVQELAIGNSDRHSRGFGRN
jgi:hypothetical protein